jgi:D-aminopeptidase
MHAVSFDEQTVDAIFSAVDQCRLPGAAVGIAIHRKPVYRKGFGLAALELPVLLSPSIRMRIGSTSKHFVALAYLLLCEASAGVERGRPRGDDTPPHGEHQRTARCL